MQVGREVINLRSRLTAAQTSRNSIALASFHPCLDSWIAIANGLKFLGRTWQEGLRPANGKSAHVRTQTGINEIR
jgi:hypothetical protein